MAAPGTGVPGGSQQNGGTHQPQGQLRLGTCRSTRRWLRIGGTGAVLLSCVSLASRRESQIRSLATWSKPGQGYSRSTDVFRDCTVMYLRCAHAGVETYSCGQCSLSDLSYLS